MGMVLTVEAWVIALFGWAWLTVQDMWHPTLLCAHVYYGFLLLTTSTLLLALVMPDARQTRVAYFNTVLGLVIFYACCIGDTFPVLGAPVGGRPLLQTPRPAGAPCCSNCDITLANRVLFFMDSPLFVVQAGLLVGYLLVQFLIAAFQVLDEGHRTIWCGTAWTHVLGVMLSARCVVVFDGSTLAIVPDAVYDIMFFLRPFSTLVLPSVLYQAFTLAFLVFALVEGAPTLDPLGFRIVRSVAMGVSAGFAVLTGLVFGLLGMLTPPLLLALCVLALGNAVGMLEAFLGRRAAPATLQEETRLRPAPRALATGRMQGGKKAV